MFADASQDIVSLETIVESATLASVFVLAGPKSIALSFLVLLTDKSVPLLSIVLEDQPHVLLCSLLWRCSCDIEMWGVAL